MGNVTALAVPRRAYPGQLSLISALDEAGYYHSTERFGFFSILSNIDGKKRQNSFRLSEMAEVIPILPTNIDTWMSQCEFIKPNRRIINLARLTLIFVDLDCYTLTPQQALASLLWHCDDIGLPHPSITIFSGRGLQAKWLLGNPLPRWALPRWNAVQSQLVSAFALLGADQNAKDASRVLRLVNTTNTKSGQKVQVIHTTPDSFGQPARYSFEYFSEVLLPNSRGFYDKKNNNHPFSEEEKQAIALARHKRERSPKLKLMEGDALSGLHRFSGRQLAWHRVEDIRKLVAMRGGVRAQQSMQTLFMTLNFLLLSGATNSTQMYYEAASLAREFGFGEFNRTDELSTLYAKAKENEAGKTVLFNGREYPALYTPKNSTLIDMFGITDDEQRSLNTIISKDMAKERDAKRKREFRLAAGISKLTREQYTSMNMENRAIALKMKSENKSIREIAASLNVSKSSVARWIS